MAEPQYIKLSSAKIQEEKNLVISECSKGGYTLAQQMVVKDGTKKINIYLKGAIHINDVEGLHNLRDALNIAIAEVENQK